MCNQREKGKRGRGERDTSTALRAANCLHASLCGRGAIDRARRGITIVELVTAMFILVILGWALVQLMSSGLLTWRSGEHRRGAYERAQFIFDRIGRDFASLYPRNPPMRDEASFQADSLFAPDWNGTDHEDVRFAWNNMSESNADAVRWLQATNPAAEASIEYALSPPGGTASVTANSAIVHPKITLCRALDCEPTADVIVEVDRGGVAREVAKFASGLRDQTIVPHIDLTGNGPWPGSVTVRIRIVPLPGKESNVKLFEAKRDDSLRPVFRMAISPSSRPNPVDFVSDYRADGTQYLVFVQSARVMREVAYYLDGDTLYRAQRNSLGGAGSLFRGQFDPTAAAAIAKGIIYFGCEFKNAAGEWQPYWREAESVPPSVRITIATVPLSGPGMKATLREDISADATTIPVDTTRPFVTGTGRQFVKIGNEWIEYGKIETGRFVNCVRGVRGTIPATHTKGAAVTAGDTFCLSIPIPASGYRSR